MKKIIFNNIKVIINLNKEWEKESKVTLENFDILFYK